MSKDPTEQRVLIVGGGIAGLSLAALLHQRKFKNVYLVEKVKKYGDAGYVLGLWGNGLRMLRGLGLYDTLMEMSSIIHNFHIMDDAGASLCNFTLDELNTKFEPAIMVRRSQVLKVLYDHIQDKVEHKLGTTIVNIDQNEEAATVTFSDNTTREFDVVVGADGIRSVTRSLAPFGDIPVTFWNFKGCGFWVKASESASDLDLHTVIEMWGPDGKMFGIYPHGEDTVVACCTIHCDAPEQPWPVEQRLAHLREEFKGWGHPVPAILDALGSPDDMYGDDLLELSMDRPMFEGRTILIGDAAHAILPTAGAGAALAMESAAVLADELCWCDGSYKEVIRTFQKVEDRRLPRIKHVRGTSNTLADAITWTSPMAVVFRNLAMKQASASTFSKKMLSLMYEPI